VIVFVNVHFFTIDFLTRLGGGCFTHAYLHCKLIYSPIMQLKLHTWMCKTIVSLCTR